MEAVEEASMAIALCRDYKVTYPVFIDTEGAGGNGRADGLDIETRTKVCQAFCQTVEDAGYTGGIYGSRNWFRSRLRMDALENHVIWLAEYRENPVYAGNLPFLAVYFLGKCGRYRRQSRPGHQLSGILDLI